MRWIVFLIVFVFSGFDAWAENPDKSPPVLSIIVDLPENIDPGLTESLIVELEGKKLEPNLDTDPLRFRQPLETGSWTIKALIPGWGADKSNVRVTEETTGIFQITLRPHLTGLDLYPDKVRLEWVGLDNQRFLSATQIDALRFVDPSGSQISISKLADARLYCRNWIGETLAIDDHFKIEPDGIISVIAPNLLEQRLRDCDRGDVNNKLTILAQDVERGLVYEGTTERFRFGQVTVKGRIIRGKTTRNHVSLENRKVSVGGRTAKTNAEGWFEIEDVPIGEITASAHARAAASAQAPHLPLANFWARGKIELEGPAEIEMTLEIWDASRTNGPVEIISQSPIQRSPLGGETLVDRPEMTIPPNARFKLVNLIAIRDLELNSSVWDSARASCADAFKNGWRLQNCTEALVGRRVVEKAVWSGPEVNAERLGELIIDPDVWFVPEGSKTPSLVAPDYYQGDWGYGSFGYAVTVLAIEQNRVAIQLPQTDRIGWIDIEDLEDPDNYQSIDPESFFLGFSPIQDCLWAYGDELVVVEGIDENQFSFRYPTAHDLWSVYDETEQPPQSQTASYSVEWRKAYSIEPRLLLVPIAGKEC